MKECRSTYLSTAMKSIIPLFTMIALATSEVFLMRNQAANSSLVELACYFNGPQTESVGLSWVLPHATKKIDQTNERWRHTTRSGMIKGHFEYYGHIWISTTALMVKPPNVLPPVLDERWNDFRELRTAGDVYFTPPVQFDTDRLHFSVLARDEAHIALSTNTNPYSSHTYWIALDHYAVAGSAIRKCKHGLPRSLLPRFQDCKQIRAGHKGMDMLRNGTEWMHFTLELRKKGGWLEIKLKTVNDDDPAQLLLSTITWVDTAPLSDIKYLSFRTKDTPGLWRVHDYRLVLHNGLEDGEGFNIFQINETHTSCLQMYYFFSDNSYGPAVVNSKDGTQSLQLEPTRNTWKMLKVEMIMKPPKDHVHFVPPHGKFIRNKVVFALSQPLRLCGDSEFFVSRISAEPDQIENAKCIDIKYKDKAYLQSETSLSKSLSTCAENKFSSSCNISCGRVVGDYTCRGKVTCDSRACSCLPGYLPTSLWTTACQHAESSDIATPATAEATTEEFEQVVTEAAIDDDNTGPGEDAAPEDSDDETDNPDDMAKNAAAVSGECKQNRYSSATIVLSITTILLLICLVVFAGWYWRTRMQPQMHAFNVRWQHNEDFQNSQLIDSHEDS